MEQKTLLFIFTLLLTLTASADPVEINGIYYNLIPKGKAAEVASGSIKYAGSVAIPETVIYNDITYIVTSISGSAFYNCSGLKSVDIPNSVTMIESSAFYGSGLISVDIPNSVTSIGEKAFYNCVRLTSVTIPQSVTSIGDKAFEGCSTLNSIVIENGNTQYDSRDNCNAIIETATNTLINGCQSTIIPNSVKKIGSNAFYNCSGLKSINIPNSVTSIGNAAFMLCKDLTSVIISNSVKKIGDYLFSNCSNLTEVIIPNSVTSIGVYAFSGCTSLKSVNLPNSVTEIKGCAFRRCTSLKSVNLPNSLERLGENTFQYCSSLTEITIPNNVTYLGGDAFNECSSLTSVTIGNSVTGIGAMAFSNCPELTNVYCYAEMVPSKTSSIFLYSDIEYATLHVPAVSVEAYKTTSPWSGFGTIKALSGETPEIKKCATPIIAFVDGKIKFTCETEGVEYVSNITPPSAYSGNSDEVNLSTIYKVTVYATKEGYENSDIATMDIDVSGCTTGIRGDVNEDGNVNGTDIQEVINIIVNGE